MRFEITGCPQILLSRPIKPARSPGPSIATAAKTLSGSPPRMGLVGGSLPRAATHKAALAPAEWPSTICPSQMDPVAARLVSLWALPNVPGAGFVNNWAGNVSFGGNTDQGTARIDHNITENQRLFFR